MGLLIAMLMGTSEEGDWFCYGLIAVLMFGFAFGILRIASIHRTRSEHSTPPDNTTNANNP
jgi:hypothetical protein